MKKFLIIALGIIIGIPVLFFTAIVIFACIAVACGYHPPAPAVSNEKPNVEIEEVVKEAEPEYTIKHKSKTNTGVWQYVLINPKVYKDNLKGIAQEIHNKYPTSQFKLYDSLQLLEKEYRYDITNSYVTKKYPFDDKFLSKGMINYQYTDGWAVTINLEVFPLNHKSSNHLNPFTVERQCKDNVKQVLASPASAQFTDTNTNLNEIDELVTIGQVDSQNSFGAMLRASFTCKISPEGEWTYFKVGTFGGPKKN